MLGSKKDLLLEIGCEELPSSAVHALADALAELLKTGMTAASVSFEHCQTFATPRRLAVLMTGVPGKQASQTIERQGPSAEAAYDKGGLPTLACIGFAKSCGVSVDALEIRETPKGKRIYCKVKKVGGKTIDVLAAVVQQAIKSLPIARPMRWGGSEISFLRPVHWVVLMFGREVVPATILGQPTGSTTYGHRFHHPQAITLKLPKDYQPLLRSPGYVIAAFDERRTLIAKQLSAAVTAPNQAIPDQALLDEVTGLVEWPVVLQGTFDTQFLSVPQEVLITSMRSHQKCFPVVDQNNQLQPQFLLVSNIESSDPNVVIAGNERVIRARLSDAMFFYKKDCQHSLESRRQALEKVVFQKQLGSMGDKAKRISTLAGFIASQLSFNVGVAEQSGVLAKCDLVTAMVNEFADLQGIMGSYYALHDGLPTACAQAIREHYQPRFSGDALPQSEVGCVVALADRLDTLVGIFGVNQAPTGDKDPFALRRIAYGIIRLCCEKQLSLDLLKLLQQAHDLYQVELPNADVVTQAQTFILARLKHWYIDKGVAVDVFNAVLACHPSSLLDFDRRVTAVLAFQQLPEASALAAANKRVSNILKKQADASIGPLNTALFEQPEERALAAQITLQADKVTSLYQNTHYTEALSTLATLKGPVDTFFDKVMVMVDDESVRNNRLALLTSLHGLLTQVADIAQLS